MASWLSGTFLVCPWCRQKKKIKVHSPSCEVATQHVPHWGWGLGFLSLKGKEEWRLWGAGWLPLPFVLWSLNCCDYAIKWRLASVDHQFVRGHQFYLLREPPIHTFDADNQHFIAQVVHCRCCFRCNITNAKCMNVNGITNVYWSSCRKWIIYFKAPSDFFFFLS